MPFTAPLMALHEKFILVYILRLRKENNVDIGITLSSLNNLNYFTENITLIFPIPFQYL